MLVKIVNFSTYVLVNSLGCIISFAFGYWWSILVLSVIELEGWNKCMIGDELSQNLFAKDGCVRRSILSSSMFR
ncbi:MAG: hypothetical protein Hyperionvirus16_38 [Hyperionvirus sp.]|uniref:Transmembrane protein n=1 Tax=Hyperionvirus sp. TaxID=2487770 RepID=A0A3G5ADV2_9VIRU|nr:MAG: hypothetical protein Hyperionvirus16_38 [Hyperionvirus sp.]